MSELAQVDPLDIYRQAWAFARSAQALAAEMGKGRMNLLFPFMTSWALCLELFLKCRHAMVLSHVPPRHSLKQLFEELSFDDRALVQDGFEASSAADSRLQELARQTNLLVDVDSVLRRCDGVLSGAKALYEASGPGKKDLHGQSGSAGVGHLVGALNQLILRDQPTWADEANRSEHIAIPPL